MLWSSTVPKGAKRLLFKTANGKEGLIHVWNRDAKWYWDARHIHQRRGYFARAQLRWHVPRA